MRLAAAFADLSAEQIKPLCDGGILRIYSVARPASPDAAIIRSAVLATFRLATPAFSETAPATLAGAVFIENPVMPEGLGTPGFARLYRADSVTPVADFSAGPAGGEVMLSEVSTVPGYAITLTRLRLDDGA